MEKGYGQKAPTLEDGTTLLQELKLDAEQTQALKSDLESLQQAKKATLSSFLWISLLDNACFVAAILIWYNIFVSGIEANWAMHTLPFFLIIMSFILGKHRKRGHERLAYRAIEIIQESKVAPTIMSVYRRYMPGDTGAQRSTYVKLITTKDSSLNGDETYRILLDTSSEEGYVVREVIVPKAA